MHDICLKLLPLLEPVQGHVLGAAAAPTYIERFLEACLKLNQVDPSFSPYLPPSDLPPAFP